MLYFYFTVISENLVHIRPIVTETQNVGENACATFYLFYLPIYKRSSAKQLYFSI